MLDDNIRNKTKNFVQIASDVLFNMPSIIEARKKAELGWPVYFYLYTFWDKEHTIRQMPLRGFGGNSCFMGIYFDFIGATHAAEQYHWFGRPVYAIVDPFPPEQFSPDEATFINFSLNSLLQFVRTGYVGKNDKYDGKELKPSTSFNKSFDY